MPRLIAPPYREMAEFRYQLRRFLRFSELAAPAAGLQPQQYLLLLALRGLPPGMQPTVGALAERLQLRHHSTVELVDRLERRGLVRRMRGALDRRQILLRTTPRGERVLRRLAQHHREALRMVGPRLVRTLRAVLREPVRAGRPH
jgi:DNA-binding MarR family transcriptional regulator